MTVNIQLCSHTEHLFYKAIYILFLVRSSLYYLFSWSGLVCYARCPYLVWSGLYFIPVSGLVWVCILYPTSENNSNETCMARKYGSFLILVQPQRPAGAQIVKSPIAQGRCGLGTRLATTWSSTIATGQEPFSDMEEVTSLPSEVDHYM